MNAAVFASGSGTNLEALLNAQESGKLKVNIVGVVCDKENAYARTRADNHGIPQRFYAPKAYENKAAYEADILSWLKELDVDMIILSGYMRIVGNTLLDAYPKRIINLHPALLPAFPGAHSILDAWQARVPQTGVTVHYIDENIDTGPLIIQEPVDINPDWSLEELEQAVHAKEYDLFWRGVNMAAEQIESH